MNFKQHEQVLNGTKTQTRRLRFPWELAVQLWKHGWSLQRPRAPHAWADWQNEISDEHVAEANRILAKHYIILPIKPHRTAKANGRIHPFSIRREQIRDISQDDIFAEGVGITVDGRLWPITVPDVATEQFARLWNGINTKSGTQFVDNPEVWALTFELA